MSRSRENRGKPANILAQTRARRERRRTRGGRTPTGNSQPASEFLIAELPEGVSLLEALFAKRDTAIASISELECSISRIDAVIGMYDPNHIPWKAVPNERIPNEGNVSADRQPPQRDHADEVERFFGTDERTAVVKKIIANASRSMSSAEIAAAYMDIKGARLDKEPLQLLISRISAILSRLRKQGKVETAERNGWKNSWRLS